MVRSALAILVSLVALSACSKKDDVKQSVDPPDAATSTTTPISSPSASSTLAPPPPPIASLVLPPVRTDVDKPCTGTFVPLCFESLPGGCCGTSVTYARCTGKGGKSGWDCPHEMTLGSRCPGSDRGCIDAIKSAVDSYGR